MGYRIAGRVIDDISGEPLSRVTVSVINQDYGQLVSSTITDAEGHFSLDHIPAGKYPLAAARRGYDTSFYDQHDDYNSAIVTGPDQDTSHLAFHLNPEAILRGVITDDGGDPVEGAQVMLFRRNTSPAGPPMQQAGNIQTDDTGTYEFNNLEPGEYMVAVKADPWYAQHDARPGPGGQQSPLDVVYPVTYYDSTIDEASATPLTLTAGSREEADINLHAVPALRLRVPRGSNQRPYLSAQQKIFGGVINSERIENGDPHSPYVEFVGIAPGTYDLEYGDPPRRVTVNASSNLDLDPAAGNPSLSFSGKIVMAGGGPVPEGVNLMLSLVDGGGGVQATAQNGQFEFNNVPAGTLRIMASRGRDGFAVVATSVGGVVTAGDTLILRDRPASVALTLSHAQTAVQGFARINGKVAAGVMVLLVPKAPSAYSALVRRDQSDSDGSFALRTVAAGQYTVIAIQEGWKLDWQRREVIAPYLGSGISITITEQAGPVVALAQPVPAVAR
jgi:protocatechuate 3,4-dioxygenase beta subunit